MVTTKTYPKPHGESIRRKCPFGQHSFFLMLQIFLNITQLYVPEQHHLSV